MKEPKLCRYCRYLKMNTKTIDGYTFSATYEPTIICEKKLNLNLNQINDCEAWESERELIKKLQEMDKK